MKYDPIKRSLGEYIKDSVCIRKIFYFVLELLLLRAWHLKRTLRKIAVLYPGKASVLDAGSGFGQYVWRLAGINKEWTIKGVDIEQSYIDDCNIFFTRAGLSDRVVFEKADLTKITDTGCYDLILSIDVMEHIREDMIVFKNFCRSLKKGGTIIISTPSDKGGSDVNHDHDKFFIEEHVRAGYGIDEITEKLINAGFSYVHAAYTYGFPGNISWKLSMKYPVKMLNSSSIFFLVLPFYYLIIFPISAILNTFDVYLKHKKGTGLIVTARK